MHVVQVTGTMHEDRGGAVRSRADVGRAVNARRYIDAVRGTDLHDLGLDPAMREPRRGW
jgi:hypothetical protein